MISKPPQHVLLVLLLFMLISWLFVNAFAYAEFQRANQLQLQMSALERAQQALQQSEERYRLIADWVDDVIWALGPGAAGTAGRAVSGRAGAAPPRWQQPLSVGGGGKQRAAGSLRLDDRTIPLLPRRSALINLVLRPLGCLAVVLLAVAELHQHWSGLGVWLFGLVLGQGFRFGSDLDLAVKSLAGLAIRASRDPCNLSP